MKRCILRLGFVGLFAAFGFHAAPVQAQTSTRTWVSGSVGDDGNPCTRTAPCATFATAYGKTTAGGEIDVIDPGGFGALTISQAISIIDDGSGEAGILVSGSSNGITIAAGPTDVVNLRGLIFNGLNQSLNGVLITSAGTVNIQNCVIQAFGNGSSGLAGVNIAPSSGTVQVKIQDTTITGSTAPDLGVFVKPTGGATVNLVIDRSRLDNNLGDGLKAQGTSGSPVNVAISDSSISLNGSIGLVATSASGGNVRVDLTRDVIASNVLSGLQSNMTNGGTPTVTVGSSILSNNGTATIITAGGTLLSFGNNQVTGPLGSGFSGGISLE